MEPNTRSSKHLHDIFLQRFKGKITCIDKGGQFGIALDAIQPIHKLPRKYSQAHELQQTPSPKKTSLLLPKRNLR